MPVFRRKGKERRAAARIPAAPVAPRVAFAVVAGLICIVPPLFVSDLIGYLPLLLLLCAVGAAAAYLRLVGKSVTIEQRASHYEWMREEQGSVTVRLTNGSALPLVRVDAVFAVADSDGLDVSYLATSAVLGGHQSEEIGIDLSFDHVGIHQVGLVQVQVFDFLGLFSRTLRTTKMVTLRVVPRVYEIERMRLSENLSADAKRNAKSVLSDDVDYAYVREYEMGDPMKKVHWKLSACNGRQLFTKLFEAHNNPGITVLLDFYSTEKDPETLLTGFDVMLEGAFTLANHAQKNGVDVSLAFRDTRGEVQITHRCTPHELDLLIGDMPRLSDKPNPGDAAHMMTSLASNPNLQTDFYLFTTDFSASNVQALESLKREKRGVAAVAIMPPNLTEVERAQRLGAFKELSTHAIPCVWIDRGDEVWKVGVQ